MSEPSGSEAANEGGEETEEEEVEEDPSVDIDGDVYRYGTGGELPGSCRLTDKAHPTGCLPVRIGREAAGSCRLADHPEL